MADVGVAVLEGAAAPGESLDDARLCQHRADRLVAAAQSLGDRHQVRHHGFGLAGVQGAAAAHAAHHLVEDQQDAVAVAQLAHAAQVAGCGRDRALGGAADGLGHEGDDVLAAQLFDRRSQLLHQALAILLGTFARQAVAVFVTRRDMGHLDQQRRKLLAPPGVAAHRQRAEGVAVVALAPRDEVAALRLADLDEVLARHLQRRFHGFGAAGDEIHVADAGRRTFHKHLGQLLGHLGGEKAGVRIRQLVELRMHRRPHRRVAVAQTGHGGAARGIDVAAALRVGDEHALGAGRHRQAGGRLAVQNVGAGGVG